MNETELMRSVGPVAFDGAEHVRAIIEGQLADLAEHQQRSADDALDGAWAWIVDRTAPQDQGLGPRVMAMLLAFRLIAVENYAALGRVHAADPELIGNRGLLELAWRIARDHLETMRREGRDIRTPPPSEPGCKTGGTTCCSSP